MNFTENKESLTRHLEMFYEEAKMRLIHNPEITPYQLAAAYVKNQMDAEQGMKEYYDMLQKLHEDNKVFLLDLKSKHGKSFYNNLTALLKEYEMDNHCQLKIVDKPFGNFQEENWGRKIKGVYVDQHSVGESGDSYEGTCHVKINENEYLQFTFSM